MNDLPSAHNWFDAGVIEIAADKCTLNIAGDRLDLIRKKDLPQFSSPPPRLIFAYMAFLGFYCGICRRIVR